MARKKKAKVEAEEPVDPPAEPAEDPKPEPRLFSKDRASVIAEIAARNRAERDDALREEGVEPEDTTAEPTPPINNEDEEGDEEPLPEAAAPEAPKEEPKRYKITVDGQEKEVTEEEIRSAGMSALQKQLTADQRLVEATRILNEARQTAVPSYSRDPHPGPAAPPAAERRPDVDLDKISDALISGTAEDVKGALSELVTTLRPAQAAAMADDLAAKTEHLSPEHMRAYVSEAIAFENAKAYLDKPPEEGGFKDLWSDPILKGHFITREAEIANQMAQAGETPTYLEVYKRTAKELRDWRDKVVQQYTPKTGLENRVELKRQTGIVRGAGGKPPVAPQESAPLTHQQKLEKMRAARHQH